STAYLPPFPTRRSSDLRSRYRESFSPRKYSPRSWTQFFHVLSLISFGAVKTGSCGSRRRTGANSSVTRFELTLAGYGPYCASLRSEEHTSELQSRFDLV